MKIFDSHVPIDPRFRPPPALKAGHLPEPVGGGDCPRCTEGMELAGGAVAPGSFRSLDQGQPKAAPAELGPRFSWDNPLALRRSQAAVSATSSPTKGKAS